MSEHGERAWLGLPSLDSRREIVEARKGTDGVVTILVRRGKDSYHVMYPAEPPRKFWRWTFEGRWVAWNRDYARRHGKPWVWFDSEDLAMAGIARILRDGDTAAPFSPAPRVLLDVVRDKVAIESELLGS